jgi:hypothetical protein
MQEIAKILHDNNLAGLVVIQEPGFTESYVKVDTSYSCCRIENGQYRLRASLKDDFGNNKPAHEQRVRDTSEMLNSITMVAAKLTIPLGETARLINRATGTSGNDNN